MARARWDMTASLIATIVNANCDPKRTSRPWTAEDFNPFREAERPREVPIAKLEFEALRDIFVDGRMPRKERYIA